MCCLLFYFNEERKLDLFYIHRTFKAYDLLLAP